MGGTEKRESGVGNRELGIGSWELGIGDRESGAGAGAGIGRRACLSLAFLISNTEYLFPPLALDPFPPLALVT